MELFSQNDLLTYGEFKNLCISIMPTQIVAIIAPKLEKYCIIVQDHIFLLNKNTNIYVPQGKYKEHIFISVVSRFLSNSYENLLTELQDALKTIKGFTSRVSTNGIKSFLLQLQRELEKNKVFDDYKSEIHFLNGYLDLKDMKFKQRIHGYHFVTSCINRNYTPSTEQKRSEIMDILDKIYPDEEELKIVLTILGSAFSGYSEIDRNCLFLLGKSSAGKSLIMKLIRKAFEEYVMEFASSTFEAGNKDTNKILNQLLKKPFIRVAWVNELTDKRTDLSLFKKFCEGTIQTTSLYQDGFNTIIHKSKVVYTANDMPNIQIDTGSDSRILAYIHKSRFTKSSEEVNEEKNVYLGDVHLIDKVANDEGQLNAIIDIICYHTNLWIKYGTPELPESFTHAKETIVSSNDIFQDFIDSQLIQTNNVYNRIGKEEMRTEFLKMYPNKHLTTQQIISSLKDKGIEYNGKFRCNRIQGCYICVRLRTPHDLDDFEEDNTAELSHAEALELIKQLKNKIKKLEQDNNTLNHLVVAPQLKEQYLDEEICFQTPKIGFNVRLYKQQLKEQLIDQNNDHKLGYNYRALKKKSLESESDLDNQIFDMFD